MPSRHRFQIGDGSIPVAKAVPGRPEGDYRVWGSFDGRLVPLSGKSMEFWDAQKSVGQFELPYFGNEFMRDRVSGRD
jgi:hypothetical protein